MKIKTLEESLNIESNIESINQEMREFSKYILGLFISLLVFVIPFTFELYIIKHKLNNCIFLHYYKYNNFNIF